MRLIVVFVIAEVAVGLFFAFGVPAIQRALAQPQLFLTDKGAYFTACISGFFTGPVPPEYYTIEFALHNTGDAAGIANVNFYIDAKQVANNQYFVDPHGNVTETGTVSVNDCTPHGWDVVLVGFSKV